MIKIELILDRLAILLGKKSHNKKLTLINNQGFSLVEVAFAITFLSIIFFVIIGTSPFGLAITKRAENITSATNLAQAKIEELIRLPYNQLATGTSTEPSLDFINPNFAIFSRETVISYLNPNFQETLTDYDLKKIKVIVSWFDQFKNDSSNVSLTTLVNK